jgi:hypothetical protein
MAKRMIYIHGYSQFMKKSDFFLEKIMLVYDLFAINISYRLYRRIPERKGHIFFKKKKKKKSLSQIVYMKMVCYIYCL